jgi:hypothetical protein
MSRFADPAATKRFVLGPCACEGTPHTEDYMDIRTELSAADLVEMEKAEPIARMKVLVASWNLIGDGGQVAPVDDDYLGRLYLEEFEKLNAWLDENAKVRALPNGSAAPSRASSRASGSRTRTPKTDNSSTTPSWPVDGASATTTSGILHPSS